MGETERKRLWGRAQQTLTTFSIFAVQTFMNIVYSIMNDARFKIFIKNYLTIIILLSTVNVAWNLLTSPMLILPNGKSEQLNNFTIISSFIAAQT